MKPFKITNDKDENKAKIMFSLILDPTMPRTVKKMSLCGCYKNIGWKGTEKYNQKNKNGKICSKRS